MSNWPFPHGKFFQGRFYTGYFNNADSPPSPPVFRLDNGQSERNVKSFPRLWIWPGAFSVKTVGANLNFEVDISECIICHYFIFSVQSHPGSVVPPANSERSRRRIWKIAQGRGAGIILGRNNVQRVLGEIIILWGQLWVPPDPNHPLQGQPGQGLELPGTVEGVQGWHCVVFKVPPNPFWDSVLPWHCGCTYRGIPKKPSFLGAVRCSNIQGNFGGWCFGNSAGGE